MSIASRQFEQMVNEAYSILQQKTVRTLNCKTAFDQLEALQHGLRCPECGGALLPRTMGGKVVYYVHEAGG